MYLTHNRQLFEAMYHGGKFQAIETSAHPLQDGVLTFYEHRNSFMYHISCWFIYSYYCKYLYSP